MAADKIDLEIVTPKGKALSVSVDEVTAPSVQGEFGVLPGHVPLVASLRTGIVTYRQGSESKKVVVGRGFAEAGQNKLILLTQEYAERQNIDPVIVRKNLAEVQAKLEKVLATVEMTPEFGLFLTELLYRHGISIRQTYIGEETVLTVDRNDGPRAYQLLWQEIDKST